MRLLLQRDDDQGLGAAGADAAPERSADPRPHGRPSLPLRILSAHHEGDPACVHHDGGSDAMNAILTDTATCSPAATCSRAAARSSSASASRGSALPAVAARGDVAGPPDPNTIDSWIAVHADNTATVYLGKGEFGQGNTTGLLQIAGEELDLDMSQLKSVQLDTNRDAQPGRDDVELVDPSRRPAGARGGRGGAAGAAGARLDAARRADRKPHRVQRGGVDRRPPQPLGQLRRAARRQAVQRQVHRHRAAEADQPVQARGHAACRASIFRTR